MTSAFGTSYTTNYCFGHCRSFRISAFYLLLLLGISSNHSWSDIYKFAIAGLRGTQPVGTQDCCSPGLHSPSDISLKRQVFLDRKHRSETWWEYRSWLSFSTDITFRIVILVCLWWRFYGPTTYLYYYTRGCIRRDQVPKSSVIEQISRCGFEPTLVHLTFILRDLS